LNDSQPVVSITARRVWLLGFWFTLALVTWLALTPSPPRPVTYFSDIVLHAAAFTVLMFLCCQAHFRTTLLPPALAMLAYGLGIEVVQGLMGARFAEVKDFLVDLVGIGAGAVMRKVLGDLADRVMHTLLSLLRLEN